MKTSLPEALFILRPFQIFTDKECGEDCTDHQPNQEATAAEALHKGTNSARGAAGAHGCTRFHSLLPTDAEAGRWNASGTESEGKPRSIDGSRGIR